MDVPILILDEATNSLDTNSEKRIFEAMNHIAKDKTIIIVAHRLSTIENANKIVVLGGGRIVEEGKHYELLENGGVYRDLYLEEANQIYG